MQRVLIVQLSEESAGDLEEEKRLQNEPSGADMRRGAPI